MKRRYIFCFALILITALPIYAKKKDSGVVELKKKELSFKSEPGSLFINNATPEDVVVFAGKVEKDSVLGGIHGNETRSFNLNGLSGIPQNGSLLIRVATYEVYKRKARITEEDVIYTGLVVYNLTDSSDRAELSIYKGIDSDQEYCIYVSNLSPNFVLELRKDTPTQGEIIATLPPLQRHKQVFLTPQSNGYGYDVYPTFIYVNPKTGEKTAMMGKAADAELVDPYPVNGGDINEYEFEGPNSNNITYKVSFLNVSNNTKKGLEFRNGTNSLPNQRGRRNTMSGRTDVYEVPSLNGDAGQVYTGLICRFPGDVKVTIEKYTFKPGFVYDITVTDINGNYEYDIREVGKKSLVDDARISLFGE